MQFRRKPVVIEAMNWDGNTSTLSAIRNFVGYNLDCPTEANPYDSSIVINTREGYVRVLKGDWIIRGVSGEFYTCKPAVFATKYEPV